jgi:hypothetical protein
MLGSSGHRHRWWSRRGAFLLRTGLIALAAFAAACNSLLGIEDVDEAIPGPPPSAMCDVKPDFSLVVSNPSTSILSHRMSDNGPSLLFLLNTDARPDALSLALYDGQGGHQTLNTPGSYSLLAGDAKLETCGVCVQIGTDFDSAAKAFTQTYWAVAQGTLTLSKADSTGLKGRMQNLKLRHVEIGGSTRDVNDGCQVTVADVQFDMAYQAPVARDALGGPDDAVIPAAAQRAMPNPL